MTQSDTGSLELLAGEYQGAGLGTGGLPIPGVLLGAGEMLWSLGCVQDPARSPWGSELGLDLASVPQGLGDVFWGTQ